VPNAKRRNAIKNLVNGVMTYHENDLVAIKSMQQGPGLKLANKYLNPYKIIKILQ